MRAKQTPSSTTHPLTHPTNQTQSITIKSRMVTRVVVCGWAMSDSVAEADDCEDGTERCRARRRS